MGRLSGSGFCFAGFAGGPVQQVVLQEARSWRTRVRSSSSVFGLRPKGPEGKRKFIDIVEEEFAWAIEA